jgi:hypothetical protein
MKHKFLFGWVLFCISIVGLIGYGFHLYGEADRQEASKKEIQLRIEREDEVLKNWVMGHSNRISETTAKEIVAECRKTPHQLFLMALMEVESSFIPSSLSNKGAMGLGQIMKVHGSELTKQGIIKDNRDLFDVAKNIQATSFVFRSFYTASNYNLRKTMALYLGKHEKRYFEDIVNNYFELMAIVSQVRENK